MERRRRAAVSARSVGAAGGLAVVATLLSGAVAQADGSFQVTNLNATGTGSLAGEITAANAYGVANSGASSTITFESTLSGSIDLTSTLPTITEPVNIYGPGAAQVTVQGTGSSEILRIDGGASSEISGLTLTGGNFEYGGAIDAVGSLLLDGDFVTGNTGRYGGAIYAGGGLIVEDSTISGNTSSYGGGAINARNEVSVKYSTIANNTAADYGGGISQYGGGLDIYDSTISGNEATTGTTYGGGISMGTTSTSPKVDDSIVSGNSAVHGPDIYTSTGTGHPTPTATFSLIGSLSGSDITPTSSDLVGANPLLGPLQLNGAATGTPTMAPAFNSPVIDQGKESGSETTDERGLPRPVDLPGYPNAAGGDGSDIGSVELQASEVVPSVSGVSPGSGLAGSAVVISGARISTATQVLFGSTAVPFTVNASGQLVAAVPAGTGTVDVRVVTPGGESAVVAADHFTFTVATPPPPPPASQVTKASFGNQAISLTTPSLSACTASTGKLSATLSSVAGAHGTKLKFSSAGFFLDKGVKHVKKKTEHLKHGKTKKVTVTTYTANTVVHHVPATVSLKLTGLKSGSHTLKVVVSYKETVTKHHRKKTVTVTKTIKSTFKVC